MKKDVKFIGQSRVAYICLRFSVVFLPSFFFFFAFAALTRCKINKAE
jgi:hypothetical protein